jgi:ABC-type antimicrobial peptide transport system permease subunit
MFYVYLTRELRRRMRQASFIALGLAVGIGLVITVMTASSGLQDAQGTVLHSLYGVGTDITVTKAPPSGSGQQGLSFRLRAQAGALPKAGEKFSRSALAGAELGTLDSSSVGKISGLKDVTAAAGALSATNLSVSGTIPAGGLSPGSGPPSSIKTNTFSVLGVDLPARSVGPLPSDKLTSGRSFTSSDARSDVALLDSNYARQNKLAVGSTVKISSAKFKVIGIVSEPQGGATTNVFVPLQRAQALAGMNNEVNTIYVAAASASDIGSVQHAIQEQLPKASITTSGDLASEVSGSLSSAASLASNLGKWLAIAVLIAAVAVASLLTMSAVSRRVREFGTLKALGWPSRRVVGQVMGETLVMGIAGGIAGVALGFAGSAVVAAVVPSLSATVGPTSAQAPAGSPLGGALKNVAKTVSVHLTAPVTLSAIAAAVLLAIAGGLVAGMFGGWRVARLRPAAALARVE